MMTLVSPDSGLHQCQSKTYLLPASTDVGHYMLCKLQCLLIVLMVGWGLNPGPDFLAGEKLDYHIVMAYQFKLLCTIWL